MEEDLVLWDARAESILLDNIENFPPIGINKYFNMLSISIRLTKNCGKEFTTEDVQKRLALFFKLEDVCHFFIFIFITIYLKRKKNNHVILIFNN